MIGSTLYNTIVKRFSLLNRYFKITQFYSFLGNTAFKAAFTILIAISLFLVIDLYFIDINSLLEQLVNSYSASVIFAIFLLSESILGLLPPELFIAWASKSTHPYFYLFILASISYLGGIISYFIGRILFLIPAVQNYIEGKIAKHIINLKKWGGLFVFLGAVSPLPHSLVSMASGLIKYSFRLYLMWSLFRYLRFLIYALLIFQVF